MEKEDLEKLQSLRLLLLKIKPKTKIKRAEKTFSALFDITKLN